MALSRDEYRDICLEHGGGLDFLDTWLELWRVLGPRRDHGWHFEPNFIEEEPTRADPIWCFGIGGECRVVVKAAGELVIVYSYREDDTEPYVSIGDFERTLPEWERANAGFSPLYLELRAHLTATGNPSPETEEHDAQLRRQSTALELDPKSE